MIIILENSLSITLFSSLSLSLSLSHTHTHTYSLVGVAAGVAVEEGGIQVWGEVEVVVVGPPLVVALV